jgi:hypothetical protein
LPIAIAFNTTLEFSGDTGTWQATMSAGSPS